VGADIGPRIGIDGEAEYRKQLNNIIQQAKTLDSEMKAVTSAFAKNEDSQEALTAQSEVLTKQIQTQQDRIALLEKGLSESTKKYGENATQTLKWRQSVNEAQASLNGMKQKLDNAENSVENMGDSLDDSADKADEAGGRFEKLGTICKAAGAAIAAAFVAVSAAAVSAGKALADMSKEGAAYADDVLTTSTQTGIATDKLQEYMYAAELIDVSTDTLTKSMAKQIKSMKAVQDGTKLSVEAYQKLGVQVMNADGSMRDSDTVYWEVIDALGRMKNETERDALAMQILGKSAQDLNPLIEAGSARMNELGKEAQNAGYVVGDEMLSAYGAFDDQLQYLSVGATAAKNALGTVLLPVLTDLSKEGVSLLGEFTRGIQAADGDIGKMADVVGDVLPKAIDGIMEYIPNLVELAGRIISSFGSAILDNLPMIIDSASKIALSLLSGLIDAIPEITDGALLLLLALVDGIINNISQLTEAAIQIVITLATGISEALPNLIPSIIEAIILMCKTLLDNLDQILDAAFKIIEGLADGILNALPILIEALPEIIIKIVGFITENLPKIIALGIEILIKLAAGLIKAIPQLVASIPEIIAALIKGFGEGISSMMDIGGELIAGLWEGIKNAAGWLKDKVGGFFGGIVDGIKGFLGIHSPSKVFAEIGEFTGEGFENGLSSSMDNALKTAQKEIRHGVSGLNTAVSVAGVSATGRIVAPTQNYGGLTINVYASAGQDENAIADRVMEKIQSSVVRKGAIYA